MQSCDAVAAGAGGSVSADQMRDELISKAADPKTTPFDYIVIGSGAGGGPLAARLAEGGRTVLLLEAGADTANVPTKAAAADVTHTWGLREDYVIPGYHAAATEDPDMCWSYSVRHYENDAIQSRDPKYNPAQDPAHERGIGQGGILYPRSSGLGGCTDHHAMIVIKPNDHDWNQIAALTGDATWRAENMQGYFARIENCLYYKSYQGFLRKILLLYKLLVRIATLISPRSQLDLGGHGFKGWQQTDFIDPELVVSIAKGDRTFLRVLFGTFRALLCQPGQWGTLLRAFLHLQLVQYFDPNFGANRTGRSGRPAFIPIATNGVRRTGVRERLLDVAARFPARLVLRTGTFARRLIFEAGEGSAPPRAVGVEVELGPHAFQASPQYQEATGVTANYFARREIIVAAGTFNTPQLLMLSGIGDAGHLRDMGITGLGDAVGTAVGPVVNLPGVGRNLQDRYEVSVISTAAHPFSTLKGVSFTPGDEQDTARRLWLEKKRGLYTTNGGALAFLFQSSHAMHDVPDIFIFGAPAAFRGYYWGWSKELLRETQDATQDQRDLWSWILLKAYTRNRDGTVRLRGASPKLQAQIDFHSFGEASSGEGADADVDAIAQGVKFIREINTEVKPFNREIQPGTALSGPDELRGWIRDQAWGHHACGTCRIGSDPWRAQPSDLVDREAVLDSKFRVHGVRGLRVVDASVFPDIPGYFIVTPIFMIGEKAADTLLADSASYPERLEALEADAIRRRRQAAHLGPYPEPGADTDHLPGDAVGLALSGGGVRSATFCLGVLQALAGTGRLAEVDVLSTVSGGGYVGGFLGRLYTRMQDGIGDPIARVREVLTNTSSAEVWWLRANARYLTGAGLTDLESNTGTIWRNLLAVHAWVATLIIGVEGVLYWLGRKLPPVGTGMPLTISGAVVRWSPWWWLVGLALLVGLVPAWIGFWLSAKPGTRATVSIGGLFIWLVALALAIVALGASGNELAPLLGIVALMVAWIWQEVAQWGIRGDDERAVRGTIARNRLTRGAGIALGLFIISILWALLDTLAATVFATPKATWVPFIMGAVGAALPALRGFVRRTLANATSSASAAAAATATATVSIIQTEKLTQAQASDPPSPRPASANTKILKLWQTLLLGAIGFALLAFMVFGLDVITELAFGAGFGAYVVVSAILLSIAIGRATDFVNLSSLQGLYAARLGRTYLGAANEARVYADTDPESQDVDTVHTEDDQFFHDYHPECRGGPLHLINVCVNQTVDATSGRQLKEDRGLPMCLGPQGVSVGLNYHALWEPGAPAEEKTAARMLRLLENAGAPLGTQKSALQALPVAADPDAFHVLASRTQTAVPVEPLRLSQWISISGAAFSTGEGRFTSAPLSLLFGLLNVRLGYWWNSHIDAGDRPGQYPKSFWEQLKSAPGLIFRTQRTILNEWRGYFPGPSHRLWYLSDGGHYDNTGLYELIRRRLPFIIAVDSGSDAAYTFEALSILMRTVRLDFGAVMTWLDPTTARQSGLRDWAAVSGAPGGTPIPPLVQKWLNPNALGSLYAIDRRGQYAAALARVDYGDQTEPTWLVVLKACLPSQVDLPLDIRCYAELNATFPNQSSDDQFFTDDQWESYRLLGQVLAMSLLKPVELAAQSKD